MARSREDCLDEIARKVGRTRKDVEDVLDDILERAGQFEHDGLSPDESYAKARDEMLQEIGEQAALRRRAEILDMRKEMQRHRYYAQVKREIAALPVSEKARAEWLTQSPRLALEAKLVGINLPLTEGKLSVDAVRATMEERLLGGFMRDLRAGKLDKVFASRTIEDRWVDELFELNRGRDGNPGVTKDAHALAIAKIVQKWQRSSIDSINTEGGWVRSYSGYVTRTSHSAEKIGAVTPVEWAVKAFPSLDLKRTFGTADRQRALDALHEMWTPLSKGDHFDYGKPLDEPLYPSVAAKASASRELHFKSGADWRAYNEEFGVTNPTRTVVDSMRTGARRYALLSVLGSRPAESVERDIQYLRASNQSEGTALTQRFTRLSAEAEAKPGDTKIADELNRLRAELTRNGAEKKDFDSWEQALRNRFAQIDGSASRPINTLRAQLTSDWMAIQRMAKLGRVAITHFQSLMTKVMEARYWGIPFAERYASLFRGLTRGSEGSDKREVLELLGIGLERRLGSMMQRYDVADAPRGILAKLESTYFKLTGVSSVTENQRGDFAAMAAGHLGSKRGKLWTEIGRKEQRVVQSFGLGEAEWKALHGVDWSDIGGRTYLLPDDALKLSDDQVRAYLKERGEAGAAPVTGEDIARGRQQLATKIATAYNERANTAIPMPNARTRAILFRANYAPGENYNTAIRLISQFKMWGVDMIVRQWGREIYGTIGDQRYDRVAGLVEFLVGSIVLGTAGEAVRQAIQGKDPIAELRTHPAAAMINGLTRSGFGTLLGDYLLGEFDRHGFSGVASAAGPTLGQADTLLDIFHAGGRTKEGMLSKTANRERASDLIRLARDNTPFMNLWATSLAMNTLVWHRLQEWINPGYLQRSEQRQRDLQGTQYWVSPAKTDQWITGKRASPF